MAYTSDMLRFYLGRLGKAGVVGALLVVLSLAYQYAVVKPRKAALAEQLQRNEQVRQEAAALNARATQAIAGAGGGPGMSTLTRLLNGPPLVVFRPRPNST